MVNENGYLRPTYEELLEARIAQAQELFGEDIDTADDSPLGKFIRLAVQDLADAYEAQEVIYYSRFPNTATGQNLDRLMPFANITRNPATRAEHEITFTGTAGYEVPVGFLVGTTGDEEFYLANPLVLDENGSGVGTVVCTELGEAGNVDLGAITEIINPDANVEAIEHTDIVEFGEEEETDEALRARFSTAIEGSGSGTVAAIRGAVMRVEGVNSCTVVENATNETDSAGRPAHSFETFVYAPESATQDVAEAIYSKKPLGIQTYGTTSADVVNVSGQTVTVYFSRVAETALYIKMTIATDTHFELDGVEQIKTALMEYISGLSSGEDVIYTSLYKHIFEVAGVKDVTALTLSTNGASYSAGNVIAGNNEVITLDAENIAIEVTSYADA